MKIKLNNVQLPQRRKKDSIVLKCKNNITKLESEISLSLLQTDCFNDSVLSYKNKDGQSFEIRKEHYGYEVKQVITKYSNEIIKVCVTLSELKRFIKNKEAD